MESQALALDSPKMVAAEWVKEPRLHRPSGPGASAGNSPGSGAQPVAQRIRPIEVDLAASFPARQATRSTREQPSESNRSLRQPLLSRAVLLSKLDRGVTNRVTVISAAAGSGKSSLLRAWAAEPTNRNRVALVSVEREQHDAEAFWSTVLEAIRMTATTSRGVANQAATDALGADQVVDLVLAELAALDDQAVLIVDDLHELRSADALTQLEQLLRNLPSSASVVLSSRRDPPIRLHQLRIAGELTEIRECDLRFTEHEARELLAASGIGLSDIGAAALYERTEGWVAGMRLAVMSLTGHPDPERFVAEFSGTDRAVGEYLMAEMLERQPSEVQDMLLRTSLVDRVNGELADLLRGRSGSAKMLLELEEGNALVMSLDASRSWFRYHRLLADFLRLELRRTLADQVRDLHRRAASWFADRGEIVEAVKHTLAAGDSPDAARLVAGHSFRWVLNGEAGTIRAVLEAFPEGASVDYPDLALAVAANELNHGRLEEAAAQLTLAESRVENTPPTSCGRLKVAIAALRLALARRSGQFGEVIAQANLVGASVADESSEPIALSSELRGVALLNLGIVATWSGRLDEAERHLSQGAALARAIGRPYLEVACRAHQAFPSNLVSVATARERGLQAVALAERYTLDDRPILAPALGAVGTMAIWMGEFDEGERWLCRAWELASAHVEPAAAVLLHVATGMLHAAREQHRSALEEFEAAAQAQSLLTDVHTLAPRVVGWLAATQARLGMLDEARATVARLSESPEQAGDMGQIAYARAVICMAEGDSAGALDALRDVRETPPQDASPLTLVEVHLVAGLAHLRMGDRNAAAAAAESALAVAEPDRLIFPFVMTQASELLGALPPHATSHAALLTDIVDVLGGTSGRSGGRGPHPQRDELSRSELRVLRYLPTNLTRPDIARELYVSVNTVNTHIRNIYSKLGACDRSSAVERARELRLLATRRALTPTS